LAIDLLPGARTADAAKFFFKHISISPWVAMNGYAACEGYAQDVRTPYLLVSRVSGIDSAASTAGRRYLS
jgi:hypothetical protein